VEHGIAIIGSYRSPVCNRTFTFQSGQSVAILKQAYSSRPVWRDENCESSLRCPVWGDGAAQFGATSAPDRHFYVVERINNFCLGPARMDGRPVWGDDLPSFGRRSAQFGETELPSLGRQTAQFWATNLSV
jgi:hypothetical protein